MERERDCVLLFSSPRVFNLFIRNVYVQQCDLYLDIRKPIERARTILSVNNRKLSLNVCFFFLSHGFIFFFFFKTLNLLYSNLCIEKRSSVSNLFRLNSSSLTILAMCFLFVHFLRF